MYTIQHAQLQVSVTQVCGWAVCPISLSQGGDNQSQGQIRAGESGRRLAECWDPTLVRTKAEDPTLRYVRATGEITKR